MQGMGAASKTAARNIGHSLITWEWTKRLLHWIILSAGTMSECVFLIASIWVSVNANVHAFVLMFISEDTTRFLTELATTAYVILPECIVGLAVVVTLSHLRTWLYKKRDYRPAIWTVLYGLPTLVFALLSLITLGCSVANATFTMPTWAVVIRAIAGYWFAFTSLLYTQLGTPQERDRLAHKDATITALQAEIVRIRGELSEVIGEKAALYKALNASSESALQAYGEECIQWLNSLDKTVHIDAIAATTGITKRRLQGAIDRKELRVRGTNKELVWTPSLREYLTKNAPKTAQKDRLTDGMPALHLVNE